jgi:hypothetical protein
MHSRFDLQGFPLPDGIPRAETAPGLVVSFGEMLIDIVPVVTSVSATISLTPHFISDSAFSESGGFVKSLARIRCLQFSLCFRALLDLFGYVSLMPSVLYRWIRCVIVSDLVCSLIMGRVVTLL